MVLVVQDMQGPSRGVWVWNVIFERNASAAAPGLRALRIKSPLSVLMPQGAV